MIKGKQIMAILVLMLYPFIWMTCSDEKHKIMNWLGQYFALMHFEVSNGQK